MLPIDRRIEDLLLRSLPGAKVEIDLPERNRAPSGLLVWDGFSGVSQRQRQHRLGEILKRGLGLSTHDVGLVLTLTTAEAESLRSEYGPASVSWRGWTPWARLNRIEGREIPVVAGAYAVAASSPISRAIDTDPDGILHIGEASDLRSRIRAFGKCAKRRGTTGHMAGWRYAYFDGLRKHFPLYAFRVRWYAANSKRKAYVAEGTALKQYLRRHGELPPLNYKFNWSMCS